MKFLSLVKTSAFACVLIFSFVIFDSNAEQESKQIQFSSAVKMAIKYDPWLTANQYQQDSIESLSVSSGTYSDPKMSVGIANIAAETFEFDQEMMTQFKVGISQMLPRGDSLAIKQQQLALTASEYPFLREDRKAKVALLTSQLWLDAYKAEQSIQLIEKDRALFEQLNDVAEASYASAFGKTRQQDIIRAQLELTRLDDRLTMLKQQKEMKLQSLYEWLRSEEVIFSENNLYSNQNSVNYLSTKLPKIQMIQPDIYLSNESLSLQKLYQYFSKHPALLAFEQKIKASKKNIEFARQSYKPQFGLNASYGYRSDSPLSVTSGSQERADLFSIGVSFDIPLFTTNKQDKKVQSAVSKSAAVKTNKWLIARRMMARYETFHRQLIRLTQRQKLYQTKLVPQMHDQAEASLTAYTNDDGDFSEVIRSRISELNTAIDLLAINVEKQKTIIQLNYFFMTDYTQMVMTTLANKQMQEVTEIVGELK